METKSGRSSRVSARSTSLSRISSPGSAVDLILERLGAVQADNRESMAVMQANIGAVQANLGAIHADTRDSIEAIGLHADIGAIHADTRDSIGLKVIHADIGAVGAAQVETRGVLETVIYVG